MLNVKDMTTDDRKKKRQQSKEDAEIAMKAGDIEKAFDHVRKCLRVTKAMQTFVVEWAVREGVQLVVAPGEADAQVVQMQRMGFVDRCQSEDGDLVAFGTDQLLCKLDVTDFTLTHLDLDKEVVVEEVANKEEDDQPKAEEDGKATKKTKAKPKKMPKLAGHEIFKRLKRSQRTLCVVISGCDYTHGLKGLGLKTALTHVQDIVTKSGMD